MKELLISKYIDNQLDLDEKIVFVKEIKKDDEFYKGTLDFLKSEKLLAFNVPYEGEFKVNETKKSIGDFGWRDLIKFAAIFLLVFSFVFGFYVGKTKNGNITKLASNNNVIGYRFVYYNPKAKSVALIGSFTDWRKIYLRKVGNGYWQIYLRLPKDGLYKYNFVVNGHKIIYDPSNPAKIYNGFGGFDSVLKV